MKNFVGMKLFAEGSSLLADAFWELLEKKEEEKVGKLGKYL